MIIEKKWHGCLYYKKINTYCFYSTLEMGQKEVACTACVQLL